MPKTSTTDEPTTLINIFPSDITKALIKHNHADNLIEIVLDLGRPPIARFTDHETILREAEISSAEIKTILKKIGSFDTDHRAGIEKTLHRISGMYNRKNEVVGITCRYGRAVYGMAEIVNDLLSAGKSLLFLGRPGVGKTTMLREASRILAEGNRVVVVDTSNEIGGDGDIPHPAIGKARRMQVPDPSKQHETMIEAVENHNPQVIVIDEIGKKDEAFAARTIAERGVQLVATAHGHTLENLVMNPTLSDLIGGIENVTLSDETAKQRGTQKSVRERKSPPTFDVLVEIIDYNTVKIHHDIAVSVDALLLGHDVSVELRKINPETDVISKTQLKEKYGVSVDKIKPATISPRPPATAPEPKKTKRSTKKTIDKNVPFVVKGGSIADHVKIYPMGVSRKLLSKVMGEYNGKFSYASSVEEADVVFATKIIYASNDVSIVMAETLGIPVRLVSKNSENDFRVNLQKGRKG